VIFNVQVKGADGTVLFSKNILAEGQEPNIQLAAGHNAKAALEKGIGEGGRHSVPGSAVPAGPFQGGGGKCAVCAKMKPVSTDPSPVEPANNIVL